MFLLRLILLGLLWLMARRIYASWQQQRLAARRRREDPAANPGPGVDETPLTDQDISDADFEEIP